MTTTTISTEVAKREKPSPRTLVASYRDEWAAVLPTHVRADTWIAVAQGALKRGKRNAHGVTELEIAAANNPAALIVALRDAARLGLEPGTEEFYLTCRKVQGRNEIQGIIGYQGYIELMYRAGAVLSVVAEVVYEHDQFQYRQGRDPIPIQDVDWDAEDRGELRLVYAYARMRSGATSKVVVLNRSDIKRIKRTSQGSDSEHSPWVKHPASMWLKSAVRQLKKWVPTSEEYREVLDAVDARELSAVPAGAPAGFAPALPGPAIHGEQWVEDDAVDAEIVDEPAREPEFRPTAVAAALHRCGVQSAGHAGTASTLIGRTVSSLDDITPAEGGPLLATLSRCAAAENPAMALADHIADLDRDAAEATS